VGFECLKFLPLFFYFFLSFVSVFHLLPNISCMSRSSPSPPTPVRGLRVSPSPPTPVRGLRVSLSPSTPVRGLRFSPSPPTPLPGGEGSKNNCVSFEYYYNFFIHEFLLLNLFSLLPSPPGRRAGDEGEKRRLRKYSLTYTHNRLFTHPQMLFFTCRISRITIHKKKAQRNCAFRCIKLNFDQ
jgi:hypothetical protein